MTFWNTVWNELRHREKNEKEKTCGITICSISKSQVENTLALSLHKNTRQTLQNKLFHMWDKNTGHGLVPVDKNVPEINIYWPMERAIKVAVILIDNKREWDDCIF